MSIDVHTVSIPSTSDQMAQSDRVIIGRKTIANGVGGSAGAAVAVAVVMELPATYVVQATPSQDATAFVTAKTQAGFTVNIAPRLAATTLSAGTIDLIILA